MVSNDYEYHGIQATRENWPEFLANISRIEDLIGAFHFLPGPQFFSDKSINTRQNKGLLSGVAVGVKDIYTTYDMPTGYGLRGTSLKNNDIDAVVISRLRSAGALIVGKTVTTECAFGASGKTRNPRDLMRTPGGSSSGSAAAVAAGLVSLSVGSQTSGSIIRPAGYCGVWAIKPTFGCIPRTGMLSLSSSFDHPGFFAKSPELLVRAIDSTSGYDYGDQATQGIKNTDILSKFKTKTSHPRIAFLKPEFWDDIDSVARHRFEEIKKIFCTKEIIFEDEHNDLQKYHNIILFYEASQNLYKFFNNNSYKYSNFLKERIKSGLDIQKDDYKSALSWIELLSFRFLELFSGHDALITPGTVGEAPKGFKNTGSRIPSIPFSTFGLPTVNVPIIQGENGLPVGLQVVGRPGCEAEILKIAKFLY